MRPFLRDTLELAGRMGLNVATLGTCGKIEALNGTNQPASEPLSRDFTPLLGEYAWHSLTLDPTIQEVSVAHYNLVRGVIARHFPNRDPASLKILEVACYSHTTGYNLARELGSNVTLFELSAASLRLGKSLAGNKGRMPSLVIGDFHRLPFPSSEFDLVYICSALHHTYDYEVVAGELMRVVAPGGVLFLENEPCLRQACFYKFRCNRLENLTAFEKDLHEAGYLRTIAEPYIGSRPETLFGMVENQQMPLDRLIEIFQTCGSVLELELFPEVCMGDQEKRWLNLRHAPRNQLAAMLQHDLQEIVRVASAKMGKAERGLGFSLPSESEIEDFSELNASRLKQLPIDEQHHEFRRRLTNLFGGAWRLTLRRCTGNAWSNRKADCENTIDQDGIINGFPKHTKSLLGGVSFLPDIQTANLNELHETFPSDQWQFVRSNSGICAMHPATLGSKINLPSRAGDCLFFIRIYAACASDWTSFEIVLSDGVQDYEQFTAYHSETHLLKCILPEDTKHLLLRIVPAQHDVAPTHKNTVPPVSIGSLGLFLLPRNATQISS